MTSVRISLSFMGPSKVGELALTTMVVGGDVDLNRRSSKLLRVGCRIF